MVLLVLLGGVLTLPGRADAQVADPPPVQDPPPQAAGQDSLQALITEAQQLQQKLVRLQRQAISENEELQQMEASLQDTVQAAMVEADSSIVQTMARMERLPTLFQAAREAQDQERMTMLQAEAQQLQAHFLQLQDQIMQQEAIQARLEAFREELLAVMITIDPEARAMYDRMEELSRLLGTPG